MKKIVIGILFALFLVGLSACEEQGDNTVKTIESVQSFPIVESPRATDFENLALPETATVTFDNGTQGSVRIDWDNAEKDFDPMKDLIVLEGELILTEDSINPNNISALVNVRFTLSNIIDTIHAIDSFSIFSEALKVTELDDVISSSRAITVFVPNNDAFITVLEILDMTQEDLFDDPILTDIVLNHLLMGDYTSPILRATAPIALQSLEGGTLNIALSGNTLTINTFAEVGLSNIEASNGVIHEVTSVILPTSLIENFIDGFFDEAVLEAFIEAITESGLLFDVLSGDPLTIFLPNQDAFTILADRYDLSLEFLLDQMVITDILLNHIVSGNYLADDLFLDAPLALTTFQGNTLQVQVIDNDLFIDDAKLVSSENIQELGWIHIIDGVLLTAEIIAELEALSEE